MSLWGAEVSIRHKVLDSSLTCKQGVAYGCRKGLGIRDCAVVASQAEFIYYRTQFILPPCVFERMLQYERAREPMAVKNKILVVDDEEALRTVLSAELEGEGYLVNTAADGDEAIKIIGAQQFHLILLDIKMPNVDGFEVLKFVKQHQPSTKVIMLTGFADLKNAIESKKLGAEDFVSKPYDLVDLLTTVERVLGTS